MELLTALRGGYCCCLMALRKPGLKEVMCHAQSPPPQGLSGRAETHTQSCLASTLSSQHPMGFSLLPPFPAQQRGTHVACETCWSAGTHSIPCCWPPWHLETSLLLYFAHHRNQKDHPKGVCLHRKSSPGPSQEGRREGGERLFCELSLPRGTHSPLSWL